MLFLIKYLIRLFQRRRAAAAATSGETGESGAAAPDDRSPRVRRPQGTPAAAGGPLAVLAHQIRFDFKVSLRNPRARFATFIFPVVLLVVFNSAFGSGHTTID